MSELGPVVVRHTIAAEQSEVWQGLTNAEHRASWWPSLQLTPHIDGEVSDSWETENGETRTLTGAVDVLVPGLTLGFRWRAEDQPSDRTVVVMIRPEDENFSHTRVTVIESGFASLPNTAEAVQESTERWTSLIGTLEGLHAPEIPEDASEAVSAGADEGDDPEFIEVDAIEDEQTDEYSDEDAPEDVEVVDLEEPETGEPAGEETGDIVAVTEADEPEDAVEAEIIEDDEVSDIEESDVEDPDVEDPEVEEPEFEEPQGVEPEVEAESVEVESVEVEADQVSFVEILEEEIVDGETIDDDGFNPSNAILLPEVGAPLTESVHITADLGVGEPVEVEELSEWELLLRGENVEED